MAGQPMNAYMGGMNFPLIIKICGLSTPATLEAALGAGADMVGFVFFPPSPRNIAPEAAIDLSRQVGARALKVALSVNADDLLLDAIVAALKPDLLQLHGRETPERVAAIRARFGLPVMKAIGVSTAGDFATVPTYESVCDRLLFDAKPPKDATRPGGNGAAFDWGLLRGRHFPKPWMLSGGLTAENVEEAVLATGAPGIDISSGVESQPGVKEPALIEAFMRRARAIATKPREPLGSGREPA
jgi:phosphoribosylanthranilate isomerase